MNKETALLMTNPWWNGEKINEQFLLGRKRKEFDDIIECLNHKRILSIIGPRRTGKSTLLYQTIHYLLSHEKINPYRILLFSGDDPSLFFDENDKLSDVLEIYFDEILKENVSKLKEKVYIFIDEIHFIKNWQNYLKICYDRKYQIKFIITGSSSIHLFKDAKESLLGRIENLFILPLTFYQFLNFHMTYIENTADIYIPRIDLDNMDNTLKELEKKYHQQDEKIKVKSVLQQYMLAGGYPEYFEIRDIEVWQKQLAEDIILRGIYKDILAMYHIKSPDILEKLLYYIASNTSQTFSYAKMASLFGIDTVTMMNYLGYLKQAFFINVLENYSNNMGKIIRANKKIEVLDNGIINALLKQKTIDENMIGHIVESMAGFDVRLLCEKENWKSFYYRNDKNEEVDIVIDRNIDLIPIEIKYTNQIDRKDILPMMKFLASHHQEGLDQAKMGIVITKDILTKEDNIYYIPYWLFHVD